MSYNQIYDNGNEIQGAKNIKCNRLRCNEIQLVNPVVITDLTLSDLVVNDSFIDNGTAVFNGTVNTNNNVTFNDNVGIQFINHITSTFNKNLISKATTHITGASSILEVDNTALFKDGIYFSPNINPLKKFNNYLKLSSASVLIGTFSNNLFCRYEESGRVCCLSIYPTNGSALTFNAIAAISTSFLLNTIDSDIATAVALALSNENISCCVNYLNGATNPLAVNLNYNAGVPSIFIEDMTTPKINLNIGNVLSINITFVKNVA